MEGEAPLSIDSGLGTTTGKEGTEVSAEAVVKVREDMAKAAQMWGQIAQSTKQNKQFAQLLVLLLQYVTDNNMVDHIFLQLTQHRVPIPTIFAEFLPFIHDKVQLNVSSGPFVELLPKAKAMTYDFEGLLVRYGTLFQHFAFLKNLWTTYLCKLIIETAHAYEFVDLAKVDQKARNELLDRVRRVIS